MTLPIHPPYPPMEARRVDAIPRGDGWQFEPKWDGFRAVVFRDHDDVQIQSKSGQPLARYFPELVEAFRSLEQKELVLDGEIVIPVDGKLSFDALLLRIHPAESRVRKLAAATPAHYYAFDVLALKSKDLTKLPIEKRRAELEKLFTAIDHDLLTLSPATTERSVVDDWFKKMGKLGLDGVMAKKADRAALTKKLEAMAAENPFEVRSPGGPSRWSQGKGSSEWTPIRPELVVEVEYDYFSQGRFRHGSKLLRWRPDKKPKQCTMEQVKPETGNQKPEGRKRTVLPF